MLILNTMEAKDKICAGHCHRLPADDDATMTTHRHHHHHHPQRSLVCRSPSSSSLLRNMVSPIVCLLLCVLVNPAFLQVPRSRSHHYFRHTNSRRTNASSLLQSSAHEDVGRAARFLSPTTEPLHPSTTTRRPSLRKILEGEDDDDWTMRRQTAIRPNREVLQRQLTPIVAVS